MAVARWIEKLLGDRVFGQKMRFVGGPRQCGKTTLAKTILKSHASGKLYYNWDIPAIRRRYREDSLFYHKDLAGRKNAWACFDEIHKSREWKNILKGIYDADGDRITLLVTGSARLVPSRRGGDSLAGRYFLFHLSPLLTGELTGKRPPQKVSGNARVWLEERINCDESTEAREAIDALWRFGPFPEPLLRGNQRFAKLWKRNYLDAVVRGDLRDMTRLQDLDLVESLIDMLPDRIGSPFSVNAVREDLEVSFATVKNILLHLERLFVTFSIRPFARNVKRPVRKERKVYLFEWSSVENPGARFENLVAMELLALTWLWNDSGAGDFSLSFVRNREGKETDFLLTRNGAPWCLFECKLTPGRVEAHHLNFAKQLQDVPVVEVVLSHGHLRALKRDIVEISASRLFG